MRLRNKKTGEILALGSLIIKNPNRINCEGLINYDSLSELNEDWEDYKEPKEYWWIDTGSIPMVRKSNNPILSTAADIDKEIGNYFETEEQAEKAVRKLEAWKRLKDKGFRFNGYDRNYNHWHINFTFDNYCTGEPHSASDDLDLLFGGEE